MKYIFLLLPLCNCARNPALLQEDFNACKESLEKAFGEGFFVDTVVDKENTIEIVLTNDDAEDGAIGRFYQNKKNHHEGKIAISPWILADSTRGTIMPELGHAMGFGHVDNKYHIMYKNDNPLNHFLSTDDMAKQLLEMCQEFNCPKHIKIEVQQ